VNKLNRQARVLMLLVVWHSAAAGQSQDLTPLLPAVTGANQAIREAVTAGDVRRAGQLAAALEPAAERNLWRGILAILQNDAPGAVRLLRRSDEPKALGVAYYIARQHLLFRGQMEEAIRRNPADFGPYYYMGRHYDSDVNDPEAAARWFGLALERNPGYARARAYLGGCLERLGRTEEAAAAYNAAPSMLASQLGLARLRLAAGEPEAALAFAERAVRMDGKDATAAKLAARIYGELKRPRDAVRALEAAASLAPADAAVRYQLFRLYQAGGEPEKAAAARNEFRRLQEIYGIQP